MTEQDKIEALNYAIANAQDLKGLPEASPSDAIASVVAKTSAGDMKLLPYSNLKVAADSALSATSANPVQNKAVKAALDAKQAKLTAGSGIIINGSIISATSSGGISMTVDDALSSTSTNPVQNKVVKEALDEKQDVLTAGDGITINGSEISTTYKIWHGSQAEYDAIAVKDDMTIYLIEES